MHLVKRLLVIGPVLLSAIGTSALNSVAGDNGVPQQLQVIQQQLQTIQNTLGTQGNSLSNLSQQLQITLQQLQAIQNSLGTQGNGLNNLSQQLQTLQNTVDGQGTTLTSIQGTLAKVAKTRKFYLTNGSGFDGSQASSSACASGFHMASLWEIFDTSNLVYDTTNGFVGGVHGTETGPPNFFIGWIREGGASVGSEPNTTPGQRDCIGYTSNDSSQHGTVVSLSSDWGSSSGGINPWKPDSKTCDTKLEVWCVQN